MTSQWWSRDFSQKPWTYITRCLTSADWPECGLGSVFRIQDIFLVSLGNFSPWHMCAVSRSPKKHREQFGSFIPKISQFQTDPPVSPPGTTISGRATGFPHLFSKCWLLLLTTLLGTGFHLCFPSSQLSLAAESLHLTISLPLMKGSKWHTQLRSWGKGAAPSWKALKLLVFTPKFYQLFIIKCFPCSHMALVNFQGPKMVVVDNFVQ